MGSELSKFADFILTYLVAAIAMLMGSETRVLVGVKDDQYVWKKVRKIAPEEAMSAAVVSMLATFGILPAIGPGEVWMVPDFRELDGGSKGLYDYGDGHREECESLIETSKGAFFIVVAEDQMLDGVTRGDVLVRGATKFDLLVCQVYHDLVTVQDAPIARVDREGKVQGTPPSRRSEGGVSWTVIPRRVRNQVRSPRSSAPSATSVKEPVSVTGYSRRGRMTPKHRLELEKFEAQTGLRILDRLLPGKTYVRPHFSPKVSNEEVRKMPRVLAR